MTEPSGIKLLDGPLAPWANAYPLPWPLPDVILAFHVGNKVAVAGVEHEERAKAENITVYRYRKTWESKLPANSGMMRGATYSYVDD